MRKKLIMTIMLAFGFVAVYSQSQPNSYLQDITQVVKQLRKGNNSVRKSSETMLAEAGKPKITLMDEIRWAGDDEEKAYEVKGAQAYRFMLNQVVSRVYKKQNHILESKGEMLNGNEKDIHYSLIERGVKRGGKVTYQLRGRSGEQDFVFVPFNPKSLYVVNMYVNGRQVEKKRGQDVCQIHLNAVSVKQTITFTINYLDDKTNKDQVESFAIINYNQQK